MEVFALLAIVVGVPIFLVGGIQFLVFKMGGWRVLQAFSIVIALACTASLISTIGAPPVYGNKAALVGLGDIVTGLLLIEALMIFCLPFIRRLMVRIRIAESHQTSKLDTNSGTNP